MHFNFKILFSVLIVDPSGSTFSENVFKNVKNVVTIETDFRIENSSHKSTIKRHEIEAGVTDVTLTTQNFTTSFRIAKDFLTSKIVKVDDLSFTYTSKSTIIQAPILQNDFWPN